MSPLPQRPLNRLGAAALAAPPWLLLDRGNTRRRPSCCLHAHLPAGLQSGPFCEKYAGGLWDAASQLDGEQRWAEPGSVWLPTGCVASAARGRCAPTPSAAAGSPHACRHHPQRHRRHGAAARSHPAARVCQGRSAPARLLSQAGRRRAAVVHPATGPRRHHHGASRRPRRGGPCAVVCVQACMHGARQGRGVRSCVLQACAPAWHVTTHKHHRRPPGLALQTLELARLRATTTAAGSLAAFELEPEANDVYARLEQADGSFRRYRVLPYFSVSADGKVSERKQDAVVTGSLWVGRWRAHAGALNWQGARVVTWAFAPQAELAAAPSCCLLPLQSIAFPLQKTVDEVRAGAAQTCRPADSRITPCSGGSASGQPAPASHACCPTSTAHSAELQMSLMLVACRLPHHLPWLSPGIPAGRPHSRFRRTCAGCCRQRCQRCRQRR